MVCSQFVFVNLSLSLPISAISLSLTLLWIYLSSSLLVIPSFLSLCLVCLSHFLVSGSAFCSTAASGGGTPGDSAGGLGVLPLALSRPEVCRPLPTTYRPMSLPQRLLPWAFYLSTSLYWAPSDTCLVSTSHPALRGLLSRRGSGLGCELGAGRRGRRGASRRSYRTQD